MPNKNRKSRKNLILLISLVIIFILCLIFDNHIFQFIQQIKISSGISLNLDFVESYFFYAIILILSITLIFIDPQIKNKKQSFFHYIFGLICAIILTYILKFSIARQRPTPQDGSSLDKYSFPSGHAAFTSSLLSFLRNKAIFIIWAIITILVAIERVWQGAHYPSDVVASIIIGYFVPMLLSKALKRKQSAVK